MPDLATFQRAFGSTLRRQGRRGALEAQPGFAVYRNTTPDALIAALRANYPVVAEIIGGAAFDEVALDFARRRPPADPVLLGYGAGFADHLAAQPWLPELPYLADVARIERLRSEAHVAADAPVLALADLAGCGDSDWVRLGLDLHPATRFAWSRTPATTIWLAHRRPGGFERLEPQWRPEGVLVTRPGGEVLVAPIDAAAHRMLVALGRGATVAEAAAVAGPDPGPIFASLVDSGVFASPHYPERN